MGKELSADEAQRLAKAIADNWNDSKRLQAIYEILMQYNEDQPAVKELIKKLRR